MKHRFLVALAVAVVTLSLAGTALAFDCMRVSSSLKGLQQSATKGGNWAFFDMTNGTGIGEILGFLGVPATPAQVGCLQDAYTAAQASNPALPSYFALGAGVAGGKTGNGPGVLAHNAPDSVLSNGTGIDHLDGLQKRLSVGPSLEALAERRPVEHVRGGRGHPDEREVCGCRQRARGNHDLRAGRVSQRAPFRADDAVDRCRIHGWRGLDRRRRTVTGAAPEAENDDDEHRRERGDGERRRSLVLGSQLHVNTSLTV